MAAETIRRPPCMAEHREDDGIVYQTQDEVSLLRAARRRNRRG
jgi:hypothetical protein